MSKKDPLFILNFYGSKMSPTSLINIRNASYDILNPYRSATEQTK